MKATAHVEPVGNVFAIDIEAGGRRIPTEAKRASDVETMATEAVALVFEVPEADIDLEVIWPEPIQALRVKVEAARRQYDEAAAELTASRDDVVKALNKKGWRKQDIAAIAGVSKQRMSQLTKAR